MTTDLTKLVQGGVLKAAINTGNRALVQQEGDALHGISPALARRLALRLGARLECIVYDGAGKVFADAHKGVWDVGFLAIDPKRAEKVTFTRAYITIEATFAVRAGAALQGVEDLDAPGIQILTAQGSAYDLHLTKTLRHAALHRSGTPPTSFEAFRTGTWDAVAGVRASLEQAFGDDPEYRVLPGVLTKVEQAMVLPAYDHPVQRDLDAFVAQAINEGFVASVLAGCTEG